MIGCRVKKKGAGEPSSKAFAEIQKGDKIVYYAVGAHVIVGIFDVVSDINYLKNDHFWREVVAFKIRPYQLPPHGYYFDFRKLVYDKSISLDLFPKRKLWRTYLYGKPCKSLSQKDFAIIRSMLDKQSFMVQIEGIEVKETQWFLPKRERTKIGTSVRRP